MDSIFPGKLSPVAVEKNGIPNRELTGEKLSTFIREEPRLLREEVSLQRDLRTGMVVTDIDPLPVRAAEENGIPAIGIGNFTWDWILERMCPERTGQIEKVSRMYQWGTYLRLPMGPCHSPFRSTVDIPLLRGGPEGDPGRVEHLLPEAGLRCLIAFRHLPGDFPEKPPKGVAPFTSLPEQVRPGWPNIHHRTLAAAGAGFADLVASADVVVTKPGYGIVSQILAMGKRAILVPGGVFPEEEYLVNSFQGSEAVRLVDQGNMEYLFTEVLKLADRPSPLPVQAPGAEFITAFIVKSLSG